MGMIVHVRKLMVDLISLFYLNNVDTLRKWQSCCGDTMMTCHADVRKMSQELAYTIYMHKCCTKALLSYAFYGSK